MVLVDTPPVKIMKQFMPASETSSAKNVPKISNLTVSWDKRLMWKVFMTGLDRTLVPFAQKHFADEMDWKFT